MDTPLNVGVEASQRLLDSDHIVVNVFIVLTVIVLVILVWVFRLWQRDHERDQAEIKRLTDKVIDLQMRTIGTVKDMNRVVAALKTRIDDLLRKNKN